MGIRLALGAERHGILRMVVGRGLWLSAIGIAAGLAASFLLSQLVASLLYEVSPLDPLTFVAVPALLFMMAGLASYVPARRAANVDPIVALRCE